jgi:hypothetical protein
MKIKCAALKWSLEAQSLKDLQKNQWEKAWKLGSLAWEREAALVDVAWKWSR